jgi:signal transduction protein with GAF and PtsI domain
MWKLSEQQSAKWLAGAIGLGAAGLRNEAMRRVLGLAVASIEADEGSFLALDENLGELRFVATLGNEESEKALLGQRVPLGSGITGLAAATREVHVGAPTFKDIQQTERLSAGPEAVVAAPLLAGDRVLGVMTGVSFQPGRRFGQREVTRYGEYAAVLAALIDQAQRLDVIGGLEGDNSIAAPGAANLEKEIVARLARLASGSPEALGAAARLLEAIEALASIGRK